MQVQLFSQRCHLIISFHFCLLFYFLNFLNFLISFGSLLLLLLHDLVENPVHLVTSTHTVSMLELEDFEAFIEDGFDPLKFSASLLLATNVTDDSELDLWTPIKKLQFDANEVEKRMEKLASANHELLIENFSRIESTRALLDAQINPLTARMKKAFQRINNDIVQPYDDAVKLNGAIKRVHATLNLLRGAGFFFLFVQQLQDCEKQHESLSDSKNVVRLARLHRQVGEMFTKNVFSTSEDPVDLLSLKLVRDYQPIFQVKTTDLTNELSAKISNDLGHHSSFVASNENLQNNLVALSILDETELFTLLDKGAMSKSIQVALTSLTRSLQSPRNFETVLIEVNQTSTNFVATLSELLMNSRVIKLDGKSSQENLSENFENSLALEGSSIANVYWARLSYKFKKNLVATMARGGPIARNLRSHSASISASVIKVLDGKAKEGMAEAVALINSHGP